MFVWFWECEQIPRYSFLIFFPTMTMLSLSITLYKLRVSSVLRCSKHSFSGRLVSRSWASWLSFMGIKKGISCWTRSFSQSLPMNFRSAENERILWSPKAYLNLFSISIRAFVSEFLWWSRNVQNKGNTTFPTLKAKTRELISCFPNFQFLRSRMKCMFGVTSQTLEIRAFGKGIWEMSCSFKKTSCALKFRF